jgi:lysyl-tRNA synthetase class 2
VNGFNELTDKDAQLQRFQVDNLTRKALSVREKTVDQKFLAALDHGLPQCSGVALGIDRLIMLALKINHIEQTMSFPVDRC